MGVGRECPPIHAELDGAERFASDEHPCNTVNGFVHDHAKQEYNDEEKQVAKERAESIEQR